MKIELIERDKAAESIRPVYESLEKKSGKVLNFFKAMAHKPNILTSFLEFYTQVWAPGTLSAKIKELAYLKTSILNGCQY